MSEAKSFPDEIFEWRVNWYKEKKRTKHPSDEACESSTRVNNLVHHDKLPLKYPDDFLPAGDLPIDLFCKNFEYDSIANTVIASGIGGSVVIGQGVCMIDMARYILSYIQEESCGECTHCRVGSKRMHEIITGICSGQGNLEDIDTLEDLADKIAISSKCEIGKMAAGPILCTVKNFRRDYEDHILKHRCRAATCKFE